MTHGAAVRPITIARYIRLVHDGRSLGLIEICAPSHWVVIAIVSFRGDRCDARIVGVRTVNDTGYQKKSASIDRALNFVTGRILSNEIIKPHTAKIQFVSKEKRKN